MEKKRNIGKAKKKRGSLNVTGLAGPRIECKRPAQKGIRTLGDGRALRLPNPFGSVAAIDTDAEGPSLCAPGLSAGFAFLEDVRRCDPSVTLEVCPRNCHESWQLVCLTSVV